MPETSSQRLALFFGFLAYWTVLALIVEALRRAEALALAEALSIRELVLLPPSWFYSGYVLLPCAVLFLTTACIARKWPHKRGGLGVVFAGSFAAFFVLGVQARLVVAYAIAQGEYSPIGGLLSNFQVSMYATLPNPLAWPLLSSALIAAIIVFVHRRESP